ncbi:alpha/beta-hydrolase [Cryphonectria parasitica EP155]|uniref:Alpha/beta-hydrolase n=1 Tax=Cryphonectria parasitica (strain ATCC 38755 / EP155) TaxID=660469 RepID=A0A9P5CMZ8_CRYP1|nr:alpha/beta-hydrolase [Cryphonectria parasitica EP155]KAF3763400.1 alpha/beta-hydrolase [Cryphonectria parasitica EP155]
MHNGTTNTGDAVAPAPDNATLHLPRILCLHGGGTNPQIFYMQCRAISHHLKSQFRMVYPCAPFASTPGPDVLSVFAEYGPFKRWLMTPGPNAVEEYPKETWAAIERQIGDAMDADDRLGATGEWVAVLGFSQGGRVAASILLRQQEKPESLGRLRRSEKGFRFGVLMAGRGPLLQYDPDRASWLDKDERFDYESNDSAGRILRIPTIHVHGMQDPGLGYHQILLEEWCDPKATTLIEWEGDHRLPIKTTDVRPVVDRIRAAASRTGVQFKAVEGQ